MHHSDNAYATMLLTMALSPNKEEYAKPLNVQEFRRFEMSARNTVYRNIGKLLEMDISGLMIYLNLSEEDAYRAYTLMHRGVQLSYALNEYALEGIDVVTQYDAEYPGRLERKLEDSTPPSIYRCGNADILNKPAIAIMGISGIKTTSDAREAIETLVLGAVDMGYVIITGGELGVSRVVAGLVAEHGGNLMDVLGGGMHEHMKEGTIAKLLNEGRCLILSTEHPDAMFTVTHAISRNKLLFALADAAFIFNTDGRRGETEALMNCYCDWIYAWERFAGNSTLIQRGAKPLKDIRGMDLKETSKHWTSSRAEQMNIFDMYQICQHYL